ncbi:tetratricopeptide repeat protein [Chrysosporum bergii ANA360D]|uniref:Probable UDP-N-acetylglucosamine--peptide N-acetylglucosaminyltransferase SPINDLY n=1 Tax=Chrysosporum bergii ANA360D TaxID=617107 RepID=A0AA43GQG6_9CYAN|nr:tetratricopeptide repeat protein [Chrysosporum bergii]MDH6059791.1 tetratricopeptide repeat protein [Chrysosporum bergii ANA360D]
MIIFCSGISDDLRKLSDNLCQSLLTQTGHQNPQTIACNTAPEIDAYFQLITPSSVPTVIRYRILSELALEKIHQGEAKSIYLHQDPREIIAAVLAAPEKKVTFDLIVLNLWQQYQEKWFPHHHENHQLTLFIPREKLLSQPQLTISQLATYLELQPTDTVIQLLINQYAITPEITTSWREILTPEQCLIIATLLKPLLLHFNYVEESNLSQELEQHLTSIQLDNLLGEIEPIFKPSTSFKEQLREQFYESVEQHLITTLTAMGRSEIAAEICHSLGNILNSQHELKLAEKWYLHALSIQPLLGKSHYNLGLISEQQEDWEKAANHYKQAININTNYTKAHYRLGVIFRRQQQFTPAIEKFSQVLTLDANHQGAKFNLALIWEQGESVVEIENILNLEKTELESLPKLSKQINNAGTDLVDEGKLREAQKYFQFVIEIHPDHHLGYYNLGCIFQNENYYLEAIYYYKQALKLNPEYISALQNLSYVYYQNGQPDLAQECIQKALELDGNNGRNYYILGYFANNQGKILESINLLNEALKIDPNNPQLHSAFLFNISSLTSFTPQQILDSSQLWYQQQIVKQWLPTLTNHPNHKTPQRRLRIGYISPDFRRHSVSGFIKPIIQHHDRSRVEVFCYGEVGKPDVVTEEIKDICDVWHCTLGLSDLEVAELIKADRIDILVDLAGHTVNNRIVVLGMKPAPIQATYLGYFATTGLPTIDYWITDQILHPHNTEEKTSETIWRLPRCYVGYEPLKNAPDITHQLPYQKTGIFTFSSFNTLRKLTPETFALWTEILKAVPHSRLVIKCSSSNVFSPLINEKIKIPFAEQGIDLKRIYLYGGYAADEDHLNLYNQVDLHLDSIPYTGCTTTCEALWMGVPTLTLAGKRKMERMSATILHSVGLDEFITHSVEEYVQRAVELVKSPDILQDLRSTMRQRVQQSPLLDVQEMTRTLEASYEQMWQIYLQQPSAATEEHPPRPAVFPGDLDYTAAINYYQEYLKEHPDDAQAYYHLGLAYQEIDDVEKAISAYLQSLSIDRSSPATYQALAKLLQEQELDEQGEKYHRYAQFLM